MTIQEWRKKHPRCAFCKNVAKHVYHGYAEMILECQAKDKRIIFNNMSRAFCRLYQVRDGEMNVIDHRSHPPMPPTKAPKKESNDD